MRKGIHPTYYNNAKVRCNCGKTYTFGSTKPEITVEVCSNCHPFYSGKEKLLDIEGRAERFKARAAKKAPTLRKKSEKKASKKAKRAKVK
jgi:large subunit ribosomal protein L31